MTVITMSRDELTRLRMLIDGDQELRPGRMCWCEQGAGSRT
jgi:hypothetical protein